MKIAHIVNILEIQPKHESSYLHVAQPVTFKSMLDAKLQSKNPANIDLIAVKHKDENIECPEGFRMAPDLTRYCYDVFPELPKTRPLPLIGDIFDSLNQISDAEYFVYTNIDIGLFPDFYDRICSIIEKHNYDFLTINREVMPQFIENELIDQHNFQKLFNIKGEHHPGWDCFIFKKDLLIKSNFGHIFLGYPPVGSVIRTSLRQNCNRKKYAKINSGDRFTFHIGKDRSWSLDEFTVENCREAIRLGCGHVVSAPSLKSRLRAELAAWRAKKL